jgi:hypothetical protein
MTPVVLAWFSSCVASVLTALFSFSWSGTLSYGGGGRLGVSSVGDVDLGYSAGRIGWLPAQQFDGEQWCERRVQRPVEGE